MIPTDSARARHISVRATVHRSLTTPSPLLCADVRIRTQSLWFCLRRETEADPSDSEGELERIRAVV